MVSAAMATQDQSGCARSNAVLPSANANLPIKSVLLNDRFPSGDDFAPKVRKPYTITKQRERWTEEEHKKFIEALKLYGRAWRRIEEHVGGTKTAVQIRSHAQKFFSKVVRESDASVVKPLEIPPPRPKRKPMHPYPRKMVPSVKIRTPLPDQGSSASPTFSVSEQENQSPTSVLSALGSDVLGSKDSNSQNGSLSPVSSASGVNHDGYMLFESNPSVEENTSCSKPDEEVPMKSELFTEENAVVKDSANTASTQCLKLFGKTLFVTDPHKPSSPTTTGTCKSQSPDMNDWRPVQTSMWNSLGNSECTWSSLAQGPPSTLFYMQVLNEDSDSPETSSSPSLPCWAFYGGMLPLQNPLPNKVHPLPDSWEKQERETLKEGSWTGSNTGSVNVGNDDDKNLDVETESHGVTFGREENEQQPKLSFTLNVKSAFEPSARPDNCMKGFVPYKRCVAERDNTQSSSITGEEERAEQRIRLCL